MSTTNDITASEGVEMDHDDDITATVISIEDGEGTPIYAGELRKTLDELKDEIDRLIENSYEIVEGGSGFYEISLHPEFEGSNILGDIVLQLDGGTATIKPGRVAIVNKPYFSETGESLESGMLLLPGEDSITALNGVDAVPVTIHFGDDKGDEEGHYLALMSQESGEFATILNVVEALYVLSSIKYIYDKMGLVADVNDEGIGEITLAQFATDETFSNHSLAMKTLEGMVSIAFGDTSYDLAPKKKGSRETYKLTASTDACSRFFAESNGNVQIMSRILETVHALITNERAQGFIHKGRVWFTTSKILEEVLRTEGGTVQGRHNVNRKLVDDALLAASSAQIVGTDPTGEPLNVEYFINAVRREKVVYNGTEYRNVWGFDVKGWTVHDYAKELEQVFMYPLLESDKPLTVDQAAIERYLKDKFHEARGRLYTSSGKKQRRKVYTQKLSWARIFDDFKPLAPMSSRQKKKLVSDFQSVLTVLADMDSKDKLHPGRPLYINAKSERDAGRGRGGGAWHNLVIEYSTNFHTPQIKLD